MSLSPMQSEMVLRMALAIIASGRWPTREDLAQCVELSEEFLGLGALLETGAEAAAFISQADWRGQRTAQPAPLPRRPPVNRP